MMTKEAYAKLLADLGTCWARGLSTMHAHIIDGLPTK